MALIRCPECGREISSRAKACIHCGFPLDDVIKPEEEKLVVEPVLTRQKASIVAAILTFLFCELIFTIGLVICVVLMNIDNEFLKSLMGLLILLMALFGVAQLIAIGGLISAIVDRAKNNNRIKRNLIDYDNEKKVLIFNSYKDITIELDPDMVQHLDGNSKVFLYYKNENRKGRVTMLTLGYAFKDDINKARNTILSLKSTMNPTK